MVRQQIVEEYALPRIGENESRDRTETSTTCANSNIARPETPPKFRKLLLYESLGQELAFQILNLNQVQGHVDLWDQLSHVEEKSADSRSEWARHYMSPSSFTQVETLSVRGPQKSMQKDRNLGTPTINLAKRQKEKRSCLNVYTTRDFAAVYAIPRLVERFGQASHMGILDPSYSFYINDAHNAALHYKVRNGIAIVCGDPLCDADQYPGFLDEFRRFRKHKGLGIMFCGATDVFARHCSMQRACVTIRVGRERSINPLNNTILKENRGRRMIKQNKLLLDPNRGSIRVNIYVPARRTDPVIQSQLVSLYTAWREKRNRSCPLQAYMTVFDPFALPGLMIYIYTTDTRSSDSRPNGFAALRRLGAKKGYHIDPCIASADAPRGTTDLLIFAAMSMLNHFGVDYLSLGFEPSRKIQRAQISGLNSSRAQMAASFYKWCFDGLHLAGKEAFNDKWRPDVALESESHLIFPEGFHEMRHGLAILHLMHVSVRHLLKVEGGNLLRSRRRTDKGTRGSEAEQKG